MFIAVHSPWLQDYIDIALTVLVILTVVGLFLDRYCKTFTDGLRYKRAKIYVNIILYIYKYKEKYYIIRLYGYF